MKFMVTWSLQGGQTEAAAKRFLAGDAAPPEGITQLGRWHAVDLSCGWALNETNDAAALYALAVKWADELDMQVTPVIEDEAAGAALAAKYGGA